MKKWCALLLLGFIHNVSFAQHISAADNKFLRQKEDSLKGFAKKIILGRMADDRLSADSMFTRIFVRALKTPNSLYYPFDSLETISMLYAPDSSFRIFTWQMAINENVIRHHGAIQMRTYDGSLKLFKLVDRTVVTQHLEDTVGNNLGWIGAIYYKIIQKKSSNQNFYTLLGYDEHNLRSDRKIIEVLTFSNDEPVFGGRYFSFEEDTVFRSAKSRYIIEFKKDAGPRLTYDPELDMIVTEHLVSESDHPEKKWTLIGNGDFEGFKWKSGKWVHVPRVSYTKGPESSVPMPNPLRDDKGNLLEDKTNIDDQDPLNLKPKTKPAVPKKKKGE